MTAVAREGLRSDIRRMLASAHWTSEAAFRTAVLLIFLGVLCLFGRIWAAGALLITVGPLSLLGWLPVYRRAEVSGKVEAAERQHRQDWAWFYDAGPLKKAAATALILALFALLFYLNIIWDVSPNE